MLLRYTLLASVHWLCWLVTRQRL